MEDDHSTRSSDHHYAKDSSFGVVVLELDAKGKQLCEEWALCHHVRRISAHTKNLGMKKA